MDLPSESAARREAFRKNNVPTSQPNNYERLKDPNASKGSNFEILKTKDVNGNDVEIKHHPTGHEFKDNGTYERPHYHGPKGEHLNYQPSGYCTPP